MKKYWLIVSEQFSALSEREKWLLASAGWIAVIFLLYVFVVEPAQIQNSEKRQQLHTLQSNIGQLAGKVTKINRQLQKDPDEEIDKQYTLLVEQSQELSLQLSELVKGLVTPSDMASLLEQVLQRSNKLKLIELASLPSEPITLEGSDESIGYYVHPVRIELTGKYFDIEEYLKKLEDMPVKYYWRSFDYQVEEYPTARLILVVYTLGSKQEFIGG